MTNKTLITEPITTVRYGNLKAFVYWDKKSYLTVYISNGIKITNTIYIPTSELILKFTNGNKQNLIDLMDNIVSDYLKNIYNKNVRLERKRNILKSFTSFKIKNKIPFFLLKRNKKTNFL